MNRTEESLDVALASPSPVEDPELEPLVRVASRLRGALAAEPRDARAERALFVRAVTSRRRAPIVRRLPWAAAAAAFVIVVSTLGRTALPGEPLYGVRKILHSVGLATSPLDTADDQIRSARQFVTSAERALDAGALASAADDARSAIASLEAARDLLSGIDREAIAGRLESIEALQARAFSVIAAVVAGGDENGASGPSGGEEGGSGEQGESGAQGSSGGQGETGDVAPGGQTGEQGAVGESGGTGDQGPSGDTESGAQGSSEEQGGTGEQGETGEQGGTGEG